MTLNVAKPLLPVCGKPVIEYIMERLNEIKCVERIIISTNLKFGNDFKRWAEACKDTRIEIVIEESCSEEEKLGVVKALSRLSQKLENDALVIAGDNLFTGSLKPIVEKYFGETIIALYDVKDVELAKLYGVVQIDDEGRIIDFVEKPERPVSTLVSTGIYIFPKKVLDLVKEYLCEGGERDKLGEFIRWLYKKVPVYGYMLDGEWWDIGDIKSYKMAVATLSMRFGYSDMRTYINSDSE